MKRRDFIAILGGAAASGLIAVPRRAWPQDRIFQVGLISAVPLTDAMLSAFKAGMAERGYVEGQNLFISATSPNGTFEQDPGVVAALVGRKPDVIVAWATPTVMAVRRAASSIPIVMVSVGDPVHSGFVASLSRPGGGITGVSIVTSDLSAKIVEILLDFMPGMKRAGVISNSHNANVALQQRETESALGKLGLRAHVAQARTQAEYERAIRELAAQKVESVIMLADPTTIEHGQRIAEVAQELRLPTAFQRRENVVAGGLFAYGGNIVSQFRQAAFYVDRILKGAKPADLPVEQPTKFEFTINLKTAKAIGLTVPPTLLARADEVIE